MKNSKGKSLTITYLLWLVGGIAGLHHYYLGRDLHGFLWLSTLGGYFGFGWLRDVFHISEYVAEANEDKNYLKKIKDIVKQNKKVTIIMNVLVTNLSMLLHISSF